ncbi:hypothetical protein BOTBODRAFT_35860 [Botryobasidium botryosum FD-172 SS1]|uniref:FAD-binding domain-containing protein n=1 Tax=Botryobasidium botryosum (strain FD-172 SS1) TaxID=930990 RepID=A0A067MGC1_BOTB1|nr:hypothetical protein BOTBODRAFT_35860 [Botryobasidium botryosum FD-172 SS1]
MDINIGSSPPYSHPTARMSFNLQPAVLVVGAGPSGLVAALSLAKHGVPVRIIEKSTTYQVGLRGAGIQPRTQEVFTSLGVWDTLSVSGVANPIMKAYGPNGRDVVKEWDFFEKLEPSPGIPLPNPCAIPQDITEAVLRDALKEHGVQLELGKELVSFEQDDEGVTAQIASHVSNASGAHSTTTETLKVGWLLGADGARGVVRKLLHLDFLGETRDAEAILIADVQAENIDRSCSHFWGSPDTTSIALRPIVAPRCSFLAMGDLSSSEPAWGGDLAALQEFFNSISKRNDIKFTKVAWISKWRPNIRMVDKFTVGRVFVMGDAAHVHSPTGGQGLNSSVQDAYNLAWKLALAYKKTASPSLLSTYESERMPVIAEMLNLSTNLLNLVNSRSPNAPALAPGALAPATGFSVDAWSRGLKLRQLGVNYRWSTIVVDERTPPVAGEIGDAYGAGRGTVRAGDRAPDAPGLVDTSKETTTTLFKEFSPTAHTALVFAANDGSIAVETLRALAAYNPRAPANSPLVQSIIVLPSALAPHACGAPSANKTLVDRDGHAHREYEIATDGIAYVVIVRPDGVVGAIVEGAAGIDKYFKGVFGEPQLAE